MKSYFDNVVYLDIETSGISNKSSEILEIGAIKFECSKVSEFEILIKPQKEIPEIIFTLCKNLTLEKLNMGSDLKTALIALKNFIGDLPLICHNGKFEREFLEFNFSKYNMSFNNEILDTMELFTLIEPHHKDYNLNYFIKNYLGYNLVEDHRGLSDSINTLKILNKILEKNNIGNFISSYSIYLKNWNWLEYLTYYNLHNELLKSKDSIEKVYENIIEKTEISFKTIPENCEDLLKDEPFWKNTNHKYKFRNGQFQVMKQVRKTLTQEQVSLIEAPTGTGKSIAYLLPALKEALKGKKIFISTNTKELQSQLVNKDLPFLINTLGLNYKLNCLLIKGKSNYLCPKNIEDFLKDISLKIMETLSLTDRLGIVYLHHYTLNGNFGDYEDINYWIIDNFNIQSLIPLCRCDSDSCDIKYCHSNCFYKNTVEQLKDCNIVILNHALLLKWPYEEEIKNVIIDEAHNLSDSIFDAYADSINSLDLIKLFRDILDYEHKKGYLYFIWKYITNRETHFLEKIRDKIEACNLDINSISNIACTKQSREYNLEVSFNPNYSNYENLKRELLILKENLNDLYKSLKRLIDTNTLDSPRIKNRGEIFIKKCDRLKEYIDLIEIFVTTTDEDKCYGFFCEKNFIFWEAYIKYLGSSSIFFERFLSLLDSGVLLSATLKNNNTYENFKNSLALNKLQNKHLYELKTVDNTFNLAKRTIVCNPLSPIRYYDKNFIDYMVECVLSILDTIDGNVLVLFTSKKRLLAFKDSIVHELNKRHICLYDRKKDIIHLKDNTKRSVLLGSKGFFEGIDLPGDSLNFIILDKLPNINPKNPLYEKLINKTSNKYNTVNLPRLLTSFKQCFGRLIRTEFDYGYFLILDGKIPESNWNKLNMEFPNVPFIKISNNKLLDSIKAQNRTWHILNLELIISLTCDDLKSFLSNNQEKITTSALLIEYLNKFYKKEFENKLLLSHFQFICENKYILIKYIPDCSLITIKNKALIKKVIHEVFSEK